MKLNIFSTKSTLIYSLSLIALANLPSVAHAGCKPSDPFGNNNYNICPQGFAFSFTQNFEQSDYVRGEHFSGDPIQPGIPGKLTGTTNGFYTGVSVSGGTTTVTTSTGETIINGIKQ